MNRLSLRTLPAITASHVGPEVDPRALRMGQVHLGIGAFHRAHQAVFTERAAAAKGETCWGIAGVTQRSARVRDQLRPQDGLYTVLERGDGAAPPRIVGSIRDVLAGNDDPPAVTALIADPAVTIVTLTVTEKGYRRGPDGRLDLADPDVAADLGGGGPRTTVGQLVRGMQRRHAESAAPLTVVCCDNLTGNGRVLRGLVADFVAALPCAEAAALAEWLDASVRFPSSMVDRIVPATTDADHAEIARLLGVDDHGAVVTEPFAQWVIEDDFAAARPAWELAGATVVEDVGPFEQAKLRMLNASHSMLAYLGALRGYRTIAEAVADPSLAQAADSLMREDVAPTLAPAPGLDLDDYRAEILHRFANPALRHRCEQVAMDGSQKLPVRLLGTIRDRLAAGTVPQWATLTLAGWMAYVWRADSRHLELSDPLADRLRAAVARADSAEGVVDALLGIEAIFGSDLREHAGWRCALVERVAEVVAR